MRKTERCFQFSSGLSQTIFDFILWLFQVLARGLSQSIARDSTWKSQSINQPYVSSELLLFDNNWILVTFFEPHLGLLYNVSINLIYRTETSPDLVKSKFVVAEKWYFKCSIFVFRKNWGLRTKYVIII